METMTPKERIDAVIKHQAVDRTPFTVIISVFPFQKKRREPRVKTLKRLPIQLLDT